MRDIADGNVDIGDVRLLELLLGNEAKIGLRAGSPELIDMPLLYGQRNEDFYYIFFQFGFLLVF